MSPFWRELRQPNKTPDTFTLQPSDATSGHASLLGASEDTLPTVRKHTHMRLFFADLFIVAKYGKHLTCLYIG